MVDRSELPFRKNCEGYFVCENRKILARDSGKGFIEFPGGGIDEDENPTGAIIRETMEETGAIVEKIESLGSLKFIWDENWAKTEKQKKRYLEFQGEEMFFFKGKIKEFTKPSGDAYEEGWKEEPRMGIIEVIEKIKEYGWTKDMEKYRKLQLNFLEELR